MTSERHKTLEEAILRIQSSHADLVFHSRATMATLLVALGAPEAKIATEYAATNVLAIVLTQIITMIETQSPNVQEEIRKLIAQCRERGLIKASGLL